ncbi:MAG TPA: mandelate racemase/muconate lactonizing enzyme family protein [Candidatus Obscuribacterales bacterium]
MNDKPCRISDVGVRLVRVPVNPPRGDAIQQFDALELPLVSISDASGNTGTGFGYTIGTGGTTIVELLKRELIYKLIGQDSRRIEHIHNQLLASIHALTPGCISSAALAAIDVALWDLAGKRTNTPLYILLGGAHDGVPVYNTHVGWLNRPLDEMVELCREAVHRDGFRALKLKVGKSDPFEDVERVAAVRQAVGKNISLMVDANQSWYKDEAIRRARLLEPYDLVWLEEPMPATDVEAHRVLGLHTSIPRAGGESLYSLAYFHAFIRNNGLDILQPDVVRIGGISNALKVCHMAEAAGLRVAPHVSPELSVTVAAAVKNSMFVEYIPQMEPVLKNKVIIENGLARPFDKPGHGIEFNEDALNRLEVKNDQPGGGYAQLGERQRPEAPRGLQS